MPRGVNTQDEGRIQGRNVVNANSSNIVEPGIVTDGLLMHLDAGNYESYPLTGTTWYDLSGRGNHGTLTNGPIYARAGGGSIDFDETNDYVSVPNIKIQAHSICAFFRLDKLNDFQGIFGQADSIWSNLSVAFRILDTNKISYLISSTGEAVGNFSDLVTDNTVSISTWYHVCATFARPNRAIYLNGIKQATTVPSGTATVDYDLFNSTASGIIGGYAYGNGLGFLINGNIASIRLYDRALTPTEVAQNFNALRSRFNI